MKFLIREQVKPEELGNDGTEHTDNGRTIFARLN